MLVLPIDYESFSQLFVTLSRKVASDEPGEVEEVQPECGWLWLISLNELLDFFNSSCSNLEWLAADIDLEHNITTLYNVNTLQYYGTS